MPTVMSQETVTAYAHCVRPLCPGNQQQPVPAVREELGVTYSERGGDLGFIEQSHVTLRFADNTDRTCPACGGPRDLTDQSRVVYANESGVDPTALVGIKYNADGTERPEKQWTADQRAELDAVQAENAQLRAQAAEFLARLEKLEGQS